MEHLTPCDKTYIGEENLFDRLSNEEVRCIFTFLEDLKDEDKFKLKLVCKRFYALARDHTLYKDEIREVKDLFLKTFSTKLYLKKTNSFFQEALVEFAKEFFSYIKILPRHIKCAELPFRYVNLPALKEIEGVKSISFHKKCLEIWNSLFLNLGSLIDQEGVFDFNDAFSRSFTEKTFISFCNLLTKKKEIRTFHIHTEMPEWQQQIFYSYLGKNLFKFRYLKFAPYIPKNLVNASLCKSLRENTNLIGITIAKTQLRDAELFLLAEALREHPRLEILDLSNLSFHVRGAVALILLFEMPNLRVVKFNGILPKELWLLVNGMEQFPFEKLVLANMDIPIACAKELCEIIKRSDQLTIKFNDCTMDEEVIAYIDLFNMEHFFSIFKDPPYFDPTSDRRHSI